ncbi:glutaredoxin domain-containing protein [Staphylococcus sp. 17KM0847]|uniref:glutaredoxin family protein n=1 Tax=Staphylococcus sp. 17KM0847 TaxID=2583989 RepID=UPI0015DC9733|nr:glutaredoxin domain-containing protein [Staphylococcus sp. 17KM0847]QLK85720.1 glutaredoxin family protein [Staphylococcus sp. 17KM0847]
MTKVIIYTQDECPPCTFIKNYLTEHNISFDERNISNSIYRNEMIEFDAFATPFILLNNEPMYQVDIDKLNQILGL